MLINYIRENRTEKSKGNPIGIIIALDKDRFGWSLCNPKDNWDKKLGLSIAINRAKKVIKENLLVSLMGYPTFKKVSEPLHYLEMKAEKYFEKKA